MYLGSHFSIKQTLSLTAKHNLDAVQVFVMGPMNTKIGSCVSTTDMQKKVREQFSHLKILVHSAYVNYPWTADTVRMKSIQREINVASAIGAVGYVVHAPKFENLENLKKIVELITFLDDSTMKIYVEVIANSRNTPENVNKMLTMLWPYRKHVAVCLDTAHLWSSGIDVSRADLVNEWWNALQHRELIKAIHLNDSHRELGSNVDKHAPLGTTIWKSHTDGLAAVLKIATDNKWIVILETKPESVSTQVALIRKLT